MVYLYPAMVYATSQPDIVLFLPCRECPPSNAAMRRQICQRRGLQHWILRLIVCQKHQWQDIWDVEFCVTDLEFLDPLNMWLQYLLCLLFVTHFVWDWRMLDASRFTAFGVPSCKYWIWIHTLWFSCASNIFFLMTKTWLDQSSRVWQSWYYKNFYKLFVQPMFSLYLWSSFANLNGF